MLNSKFYYVLTGCDLTFAFACALAHDPRVFMFMGLAFLTNWVGDKARDTETKPKGDK